MNNMPKFEKKIKDNIITPARQQINTSGYGIIMNYDPGMNQATVMMSAMGSDFYGQMYHNVPCPTNIGVQVVAPEPGRPCFVNFKDNNDSYPVIVTYFNHVYAQVDFSRQTTATNNTPRYMLDM